jgi:hypothetical protein
MVTSFRLIVNIQIYIYMYTYTYIYLLVAGTINEAVQNPGVAQWLRSCATSQKVHGSIPGHVTGDFFRGIWQVHVPGVDSAP